MPPIEILGLVAGSITAITFLPQVVKTWKSKSAEDISLLTFSFATFSVILWLIYGIYKNSISIIFTNSAVLVSSLIMLYFKFHFRKKPSDLEL